MTATNIAISRQLSSNSKAEKSKEKTEIRFDNKFINDCIPVVRRIKELENTIPNMSLQLDKTYLTMSHLKKSNSIISFAMNMISYVYNKPATLGITHKDNGIVLIEFGTWHQFDEMLHAFCIAAIYENVLSIIQYFITHPDFLKTLINYSDFSKSEKIFHAMI